MMRTTIAATVAACVGLATGAILVQTTLNARLVKLAASEASATAARDQLSSESKIWNEKLSRLEEENARLDIESDNFRAQLEAVQSTWADPELMMLPEQEVRAADAALDTPEAEADGDRGEDRRRGGREDWARSPERMAEFEEMRNRSRESFDAMIQDALGKLNDPAAQQRLAALAEQWAYRDDLRTSMMQAETDEDREAIMEEMRAASDTTRQLVREQQDALLTDLAVKNGITDPKAQQEFVKATRATLNDPFFESEDFLGARSREGRGGGPGGSFGRGRGSGGPPPIAVP